MIHEDKSHVLARSRLADGAALTASTLFLCISIAAATSCFSLCTSKRRIWNHLNQKQSQFPQCIIGIPAWPFTPCCVASLGGGAWYKVGTQQHKYAAHCAFPSGTLKEGEREGNSKTKKKKKREREKAEQPLSFFALASRVKTFSPPQIRTFLLLWTLCLPARSGGKGRRKRRAVLLAHPCGGCSYKKRQRAVTMADASLWGKLYLPHYQAFKHMCKEILKLC